jgi:MoxR-like ATPase
LPAFPSTPFMRAYAAATAANVPILVIGDPGEAKTAKLSAVSRTWGSHIEVVIGSIRDSSDFLGLPLEIRTDEGSEMVYAPPAWSNRLAEAPRSGLILDEFNLARESVMAAMLRVIEERWVGDRKLPDSTTITAIMNPPETSAFGADLSPPVANRFLHLDWHFDADEWLDNVVAGFEHISYPRLETLVGSEAREAGRARAGELVTGFLRTRRDALNPGPPSDPVAAGRAWASPRTWTKLIDCLTHVHPGDDEVVALLANGLVGRRYASEFLSWAHTADCADPHAVIADPAGVDWSDPRVDRIYALLSSVATVGAQAAGKATPDGTRVWRKALLVCAAAAEAGRTDIGTPAVRTLWNARPAGTTSVPRRVSAAYSDILRPARTGSDG